MDECRNFLDALPELLAMQTKMPEHGNICQKCKNEWESYKIIINNIKASEFHVDDIVLRKMEDRIIASLRKPGRIWSLATAASITIVFITASLLFTSRPSVKVAGNNSVWSNDTQVEAALLFGYGEKNISDLLFDYAKYEIESTGNVKNNDLPITPYSYNYGGSTWLISD